MSAAHLGFPTETVVVFVVMAVGAMFIDLFMHRHDKPISLKSAAMWSLFWVMMAMAFAGFLYVHHGAEMASLFLTGYALEEVFSVDNLFVMMAIFACSACRISIVTASFTGACWGRLSSAVFLWRSAPAC